MCSSEGCKYPGVGSLVRALTTLLIAHLSLPEPTFLWVRATSPFIDFIGTLPKKVGVGRLRH